MVASEGQLGGAVTVALLGNDPDSEHLRLRIGRFIHDRLTVAVDDRSTPSRWWGVLQMLDSLVTAGMGHLTSDRHRAAGRGRHY